jgi:hypothetical protein
MTNTALLFPFKNISLFKANVALYAPSLKIPLRLSLDLFQLGLNVIYGSGKGKLLKLL